MKHEHFIHRFCLGRCCRAALLLLLAEGFATVSTLPAQSDDSARRPYATLDRAEVTYRGPVPATQKSLPGETATIGAILPLHGPQQAEGETLLAALQVALEQEQARGPLPDGRKLILVARDESGPWGQASTEILKLVEQDHALVVLTSANGNIAHQAEQIANKLSFPILTFASDPTTTQTNVPWLFRLGPSDADQARVFGRRIYSELRLRKVLLVMQTDHDGRVGRAEFEKAARELKGPAPDVWELPPSPHNFESLAEVLRAKAPQAVVVWTDGTGREQLLAVIRKTTPLMPVFLSTKTAQLGTQGLGAGLCITAVMEDQKLGDSFAVVSLSGRVDPMRRDFEQAYRARTGALLGIAAFEAYEAVRLTAEGLRAAGANRILLRDYFANGGRFHGGPSIVPFDPAGNNVEEFTIVTIDAQAARVALP